MAILARHLVYPSFSWNRDEATYLWQMDALRGGHIFTTDGGAPQFYWPWLTGFRDGVFFSQYTVGWPLFLLAVDAIFGSPELALAFGAVLAVLGTYAFTRVLTNDRTLALVSATLMLASPIIVIQGGVYLAYLFSLGLGLFFGAALLAGLRRQSRWLFLVCGVLLGWILLTRPFDAVLWGAPLFAYAAVHLVAEMGTLWRAAWWIAVGFTPFVAFTLFYNHRVTGSFTQFPITAKDPLDTFGFGARQLMPIGEIFDYTIGRAVRSVLHNFRTLPVSSSPVGSVSPGPSSACGSEGGTAARSRSSRSQFRSPGDLLLLGKPALSRAAGALGADLLRPALRTVAASSSPPRSLRHGAIGAGSRSAVPRPHGRHDPVPRFEDRSQPQDQHGPGALEGRHPVDPRPRSGHRRATRART